MCRNWELVGNSLKTAQYQAILFVIFFSISFPLFCCFLVDLGEGNSPSPLLSIPEFSKPLTSATFALHRIFYCVARTWVVIGRQRDLLLLGRLLLINLRRTRCKLRLSRDALIKGLQNLIIVMEVSSHYFTSVDFVHKCTCTLFVDLSKCIVLL